MSKLLLVDGYSLLYRAFFSSPPFSTKAGEPTGALYGFIRMVTKLLEDHNPDYLVVAIDAPGNTFRHDADETYKANRSETPDDLRSQQRRLHELLDGLFIPHYEHVGFEADDVIGTLAGRGAAHGQDVVIVTGDGDYLQLVEDKVLVLLTRKGVSDLEAYDVAAVQERFGFAPRLVADFKGLKGDASDNIPGVPGIGDKTGMALIQKFGDLDGIYEHLEEVTPPRIRELLRTHRDQAFHSRTMATIVCDLEVEKQPEEFRYDLTPEKRQQAAQTARRFEFKSLAAKYEASVDGPGNAIEPELAPPKLFEAALEISDSPNVALEWLGKRAAKTPVCVSQNDDGFYLASEGEALLYTGDLRAGVAPQQASFDFGDASDESLASWLEDGAKPKIAHDAKALMRRLLDQEIVLSGIVADTMLMGYLCDPTRQQHPISFLAEKFLRYSLPEPPSTKKRAKTASLFEADEAAIEETNARHAAAAAETAVLGDLEPVLRHALTEMGHEKIFEEVELPLIPVLFQIECCGMLLDPPQLRELGQRLESEARRLESEIWEAAGKEFNIGSPLQLQKVLFDDLKLESGRKNKSGGYSTDVFTLEKLAESHDIVRKILDYRGTTKLKSTYVDALLSLMDKQTHRIHSTLNQTGTVSGRISSTDPNLQNVPIRTEQGRLIRKAFIAPPGHVMLSADYSQIELRILAHITGDAPLVDAFKSGEDVHARTAAALFKVPLAEVDREKRRLAKMTNYAIAYGVSGFGLAKQLGTGTAGEAQEFIKTYFETLPGVKKYIDDTLTEAKKKGYVETLMGRRRPLPDITANAFQVRAAAERTAINHPIQGTAADMMKLAMLAVHHEMKEKQLKSCMTMLVHDELVFEVPLDEIEVVTELVRRNMSEVPAKYFKLKVPLVADVGTGPDWEDTKGHD